MSKCDSDQPGAVCILALPVREVGRQGGGTPVFSAIPLNKRWNKGMKALGMVWKLPIHQCKEILRWQLADSQPSTTRDSRVGRQRSAEQTDRTRPDQTPHSSLFGKITSVNISGIYSDSPALSDSSVNSRTSKKIMGAIITNIIIKKSKGQQSIKTNNNYMVLLQWRSNMWSGKSEKVPYHLISRL